MFDFQSSVIPQMTPLQNSYTNNPFEKELRDLFIALFKKHLGEDAFNAFVLGSPHLGSFELVRKSINTDGISLLQSNVEETTTRYLYRAWKSGDVQKRGLHILRVYIKLLFGSLAEVVQLQHSIHEPYPTKLVEYKQGDPLLKDHYLTSRVYVDIDSSFADESIKRIASSVQSILAARFVPEIRFRTLSTRASMTFIFGNNGGIRAHFLARGELVDNNGN
ncbi:hypothetical protein [Acinetobacter proteolyticus]|uniref:Uncharacterized protein n=1 Tax=Acinetobacter proteolyticus TaxID=1776741 RepID=A0A2N0WIF0_9GAMM|nr:hypothetical protein [Acinetobacter proteolyticus]PKF35541.1 hypothetical protein CW311_04425 [Acinetobacter proteolyticus]